MPDILSHTSSAKKIDYLRANINPHNVAKSMRIKRCGICNCASASIPIKMGTISALSA